MGEIAEMMLEGVLCQGCGEFMGDGNGYPEFCRGCQEDSEAPAPSDPLSVGAFAPGHEIRRCRRQRARRFYCTCSPGRVLSGAAVERHRAEVERAQSTAPGEVTK